MPNVCEECSTVNTDGATVCRTCGYPLFLASATPPALSRQAAVVVPAGNPRLTAWLVGGLAAIVLLALAAFIFDVLGGSLQRKQFGPEAPRLAPVLPAPLAAPASPPTSTDEAAVAASPASAPALTAAPPLRSSSSAQPKARARKSSIKTPDSGAIPAGVESDPPASDSPTPGPAAAVPGSTETELIPSELCGDKSFLARSLCLARQCNTPAMFDHPDCVRIREQDNQRREREELGG